MRLRRLSAHFFYLATVVVLAVAASSVRADEDYLDKNGKKTLIDPKVQPPTKAELDALTWKPMPVIDALEHMQAFLAKHPQELSFAKALKIRNTSDATNKQISDALRHLPSTKIPADFNATCVRRIKGDVKSTNPLLQNAVEEFDVAKYIGVGLFDFDWEMKPFAAADYVTKWESSVDGLFERVTLRDDIVWSDGAPITAHDVEFSFRTIMNPTIPIPAVRSQTVELKYVHAVDDRTVIFMHKKALATNSWNINFPLIPKHIYEKTLLEDETLSKSARHLELEDRPVVGGPYKIVERTRRDSIVLERRDDFSNYKGKEVRPKPYFKTVRLKIIEDSNTALLSLKRGDVEDLELSMQQWQTQTGDADFYRYNTKARAPEWTVFFFGWNNTSPWFGDRNVRLAMTYAFDHEELLRVQNFGLTQAAVGPFHPDSWMFPKKKLAPFKQDLEKADELLADAGWEDTNDDGILDKTINGKKVKFEFTILCINDPARLEACKLLSNNLKGLGIRCNVQVLELVSLIKRMQERDFDAYFGGWGTGTDPDTSENIWRSTETPPKGRNYYGYSNKYVDGLYDLGKELDENAAAHEQICKKFDLAKVGVTPKSTRAEVYAAIAEQIYQDQPVTYLYYRSAFYGFNREWRGWMFSPRGPYHYSPGSGSIWKNVP
ncbi:MAG: ABC transporter substrate-binding protein [Pirellulales bacterium]